MNLNLCFRIESFPYANFDCPKSKIYEILPHEKRYTSKLVLTCNKEVPQNWLRWIVVAAILRQMLIHRLGRPFYTTSQFSYWYLSGNHISLHLKPSVNVFASDQKIYCKIKYNVECTLGGPHSVSCKIILVSLKRLASENHPVYVVIYKYFLPEKYSTHIPKLPLYCRAWVNPQYARIWICLTRESSTAENYLYYENANVNY